MRRRSRIPAIIFLCAIVAQAYCGGSNQGFVADHRAVREFGEIPGHWIEKVKQDRMLVQYVGESHSVQLHRGIETLAGMDPNYTVQINSNLNILTGTDVLRVLRSQHEGGNWGSGWSPVGEEDYWANETARLLTEDSALQAISQGEPISVSIFAWCWDIIKPGACYDENNVWVTFNDERRDAYLHAIARFNNNPNINRTIFVYHTAVTDDDYFNPVGYIGPDGWRVTRYNNDIRVAAIANDGVLFDQADIENWNVDNTEQRVEYWDDGEAVRELYLKHHDYDPNDGDDYGHANSALGLRKAKALWWLLARVAGWDGCHAVEGDVTGDCRVDMLDYAVIAKAWQASPGLPNWDVLCDLAPGGGDGVIDLRDLGVVASGWLVDPYGSAVITSRPVTQAIGGVAYVYDVQATGEPDPTYALVVNPAGMTIDPNSGLIEWIPVESGDYDVVVEAANSKGSDRQEF